MQEIIRILGPKVKSGNTQWVPKETGPGNDGKWGIQEVGENSNREVRLANTEDPLEVVL